MKKFPLALVSRMIELAGQWPQNAPPPISRVECDQVIAAVSDMRTPDIRQAKAFQHQLLSKWPWLNSVDQDLTVYVADVTHLFAAHSIDAGRHILNPMNLHEACQDGRPPSIPLLQKALSRFDAQCRAASHTAQWFLDEAGRRAAKKRQDEEVAADHAKFKAAHPGKTPLDVLRYRGLVT
jgi:hypothetical protein